MTEVVLALDQGTSSTRCFVVDGELEVRAVASRPVRSSYPRPGWVEQDPEELVATSVECIGAAMDTAGVGWDQVRGIGIDNQTETFLVWERATGRPIHPAIVWQCRRTAKECERLREAGHEPLIRSRTGLELDPSFSATKLGWVLENVDGSRRAAEGGELAFGDVACWLIWRLSGGATHVTEPSNASRSMLLDLGSLEWDPELLELFGIPGALLPDLRPTGSLLAETDPGVVGGRAPIAGALGDQQAALFGQQCWEPGMTKLTLGTGAFVWANAGPSPPDPPEGILGTCAWRLDQETAYALEGFIPVAGAAVSWLVQLGVLEAPEASRSMAEDAEAGDEVWFVPALAGLGAPVWDSRARGSILGLTLGSTRDQIVRGALDGVVHQVADAVEGMDAGVPGGLARLRVDGGMAANDWLMQRLADMIARPVERPVNTEATGLGAASVAGLTVGLWPSRDDLRERWTRDRAFEPQMSDEDRKRLRDRWAQAVEIARGWG
jgi:glycerol kinase